MKKYGVILKVLILGIFVVCILLIIQVAAIIKGYDSGGEDSISITEVAVNNTGTEVNEADIDITIEDTEETTEETTEEQEVHWFSEAVIIKPYMTGNTVVLDKADLTVFEPGTETATEEGAEEINPWETVTLFPTPLAGSLNSSGTIENASKQQQLTSTYMVLIDADTGEIIAERDSAKLIYPASMTKVMTVLTAMDYITEADLDKKVIMSDEIIAKACLEGMSRVGFLPGDEVTVRDLLYGTIVCSGGDAALGLVTYCLGSEEAFVEKMNDNCKLLGLSENIHFTNVVGMYDDNHYATMQDIAVIMSVAIQNDLLRDVLSKRRYETDVKYAWNEEMIVCTTDDGHAAEPEEENTVKGIDISNLFLRRIEEKEAGGNVICAKTGYVKKSGCCATSYFESDNGGRYICVTGNSYSSWRTIYDHVGTYRNFVTK